MWIKRILLTSVAAIALVFASNWSATASHLAAMQAQQQTDVQSATGKVLVVGESTFSIEIQKGQDPQRMEFVTDKNTKVEGKLEVGSTATVEYRTEKDKNIAVRVVVSTAK